MDFKKLKEEVDAKFQTLMGQTQQLEKQHAEAQKELLRLQGEYRKLDELEKASKPAEQPVEA